MSEITVTFPCDIGDTVYVVSILDEERIVEATIVEALAVTPVGLCIVDKDDNVILLGQDAFLTKSEAEKGGVEYDK